MGRFWENETGYHVHRSKRNNRRKSSLRLLILLAAGLLCGSCSNSDQNNVFYQPAEFEPAASTMFIWSTDYYEIIPKLAGIISRRDKVTLFLDRKVKDTVQVSRALARYDSNFDNIRFVRVDTDMDNIWIRDFGPVFLVNESGEKRLLRFNYFGSDPGFVKALSAYYNVLALESTYNSTGGARELNGKGTLILCEAHEFDVNPGKSRDEIESVMKEKLGVKQVIWVKQGLPQDDNFLSGPIYGNIYPKGVNGHMDEFCRFADSQTILITSVSEDEARRSPIYAEARRRMDENYEILLDARDQDGNAFNIIRVPIAPLLITDRRAGPEGQIVTSVTSYMNFIITNSTIILPSYTALASPRNNVLKKEREVERIFTEVFPGREIIRVGSDTLNYYSGGFHCISISEPAAFNPGFALE